MQINGLNKTTLLDYPGHVAATVFTGGCNFRCPFCHNGDLAWKPWEQPLIAEEEVLNFLQKRKGILEGVCITGGEPTLQKNLEPFIRKVKELGYLVKLDTNGYRPDILWRLLQEDLLDYVAMDIKSSKGGYQKASGIQNLDLSNIEESVAILKSSNILYEFRTTVVKGLHTEDDFEGIGAWIEGSAAYYLQSYRDNTILDNNFTSFNKKSMENFMKISSKYIEQVSLRGIE